LAAGVAFAAPNPRLQLKQAALEPAPAQGSSAGFPKCESTGFEAAEAICAWENDLGICGSTHICRDRSLGDPPYPACAAAAPNPDNCCVLKPHPINDWFMSGSAQHCQEPSIRSVHPASGSQHMRIQRSTQGGNPAGCTTTDVGTGTACRLSAFTPNVNPGSPGTLFNPGVTTSSFDVSRDVAAGVPGMEIQWSNQSNSEGLLAQKILFHYLGYIFAADYDLGVYVYLGYMSAGQYHHIQTDHDICGDEVRYYLDGELLHTGSWSNGASQNVQSIEQYVWLGDNSPGAIFDWDNFSVTRNLIAEPVCPSICGDGDVTGSEDCEPGADEACCPGQCGAVGSAGECQCPDPTNSIFTCAPKAVVNGVNGPFISDGGFFSYAADAPFTSVETCDSDFDSQIFWNLTPDCAQYESFNDDCFEDDYAGGQQPGDPNASCYGGAAPPPGYQACICNATVPGTTYTFLIAEWAPPPAGTTLIPPFCSSTVVEITKKTSCALGGPIPGGACCDRLTGLCTDGVEAAACAGQFQVYSDNKLCSMVECEAITGACCNTAPGAGGACVETTQAACPISQYQSWTMNAVCADVECDEVTGSCCNTLSGTCATTIQAQCGPGSDFVWTEGGSCSTCVARTGACCVEPDVLTATCTDGQTLAQCTAAGGVWSDSQPCSAVECTPNFIPIPTVSEWGLAVLALMLLIGGKIYFSRREAAMA
jgi:hypothetical protein